MKMSCKLFHRQSILVYEQFFGIERTDKGNSIKVSSAIGFLKDSKSVSTKGNFQSLYKGVVEPCFPSRYSVQHYETPYNPLIEGLGWLTTEKLVRNESQIMAISLAK